MMLFALSADSASLHQRLIKVSSLRDCKSNEKSRSDDTLLTAYAAQRSLRYKQN
jgi:hypothetical protein